MYQWLNWEVTMQLQICFTPFTYLSRLGMSRYSPPVQSMFLWFNCKPSLYERIWKKSGQLKRSPVLDSILPPPKQSYNKSQEVQSLEVWTSSSGEGFDLESQRLPHHLLISPFIDDSRWHKASSPLQEAAALQHGMRKHRAFGLRQ